MERNEKAPGPRAATWLRDRYPQLSRRQIEEALEAGLCTYHQRPTKKGTRIDESDGLDCTRLDAHLQNIRAGNPRLEIPVLNEAPRFAVVDKPPGIKSHPLSLFDDDTVTHWAFAHYPGMDHQFSEALPTIVPHRLDTGTSGCLIVTRDADEYHRWRALFRDKKIRKTYQAWCWGQPKQDRFEVTGDVVHVAADRRKMRMVGDEDTEGPRLPSHSVIEVIERRSVNLFRAEVVCLTGVTHQVRVHLASQGFPLVGDRLYDAEWESRTWKPAHHQLRASRLEWPGGKQAAPMDEFEAGEGR